MTTVRNPTTVERGPDCQGRDSAHGVHLVLSAPDLYEKYRWLLPKEFVESQLLQPDINKLTAYLIVEDSAQDPIWFNVTVFQPNGAKLSPRMPHRFLSDSWTGRYGREPYGTFYALSHMDGGPGEPQLGWYRIEVEVFRVQFEKRFVLEACFNAPEPLDHWQ